MIVLEAVNQAQEKAAFEGNIFAKLMVILSKLSLDGGHDLWGVKEEIIIPERIPSESLPSLAPSRLLYICCVLRVIAMLLSLPVSLCIFQSLSRRKYAEFLCISCTWL